MHRQTRQEHSARAAFKLGSAIFFTCVGIRFNTGPNARYGPWDFFCHLTTMCMGRSCANGASETSGARPRALTLPSGRWLLDRIKTMPPDRVLSGCDSAIRRSVLRARRMGMLRGPVHAAIDLHCMGRYDRVLSRIFTIGGKYKNGTCWFNALATIHCTVDGSRLCLRAMVAARGQSEADRVAILLDRCESMGVNVSLLTLDRGFYNTGVISLLNAQVYAS